MKKWGFYFTFVFIIGSFAQVQENNLDIGLVNHNQIGVLDLFAASRQFNTSYTIEEFNSFDNLYCYRIELALSSQGPWLTLPLTNSGTWVFNNGGPFGPPPSLFQDFNVFPMRSSVYDYAGQFLPPDSSYWNSKYWYVNDFLLENESFFYNFFGTNIINDIYFKIDYNYSIGANLQPRTASVFGQFKWFGDLQVNSWPLCTNVEKPLTDFVNFVHSDNSTNRVVAFNDDSRWSINNNGTASAVVSVPNVLTSQNTPSVIVPYDEINIEKWITYSRFSDGVTTFLRTKKWPWGHAFGIQQLVEPPVMNVQSPNVLISDIIEIDGGTMQFWGNGLQYNLGELVFSPSVAGAGTHNVNFRTENDGCASNWLSLNWFVQPVSNMTSSLTNFDLPYTFGTGEGGGTIGFSQSELFYIPPGGTPLDAIFFPGGYKSLGSYHQVCAGSQHEFRLTNTNINPFLVYEWEMEYGGVVTYLGFGTQKTIQIPSQPNLNYIFNSNPNMPLDISPFGPHIGIPYLVVGGTNWPSSSTRYSLITGDMVILRHRAINQVGQASVWKSLYLGIVPVPAINNTEAVCFDGSDGTIELDPSNISNSPVYHQLIDVENVRNVGWNIFNQNNGVFQYWNESSFPTPSSAKLFEIGAVVRDSSMFYVCLGNGSDNYFYMYDNGADRRCSSNYTTLNFVRAPEPSVISSHVGEVSLGQPVQIIISGNYFDSQSDSIVTNFSNNPGMNYQGDSVWVFFNDLGEHSSVVTVTDQYGCSNSISLINYWYVQGALSVVENEFFLDLYPNPTRDHLFLNSNENFEIYVIDALGAVVFTSSDAWVDLTELASGSYNLVLKNSQRVINRVIIKL
jgi:hypothetical protein